MEDKAMDSAPIWDDLTTFDGAAWRGLVDIVSAGFPCQPWSVVGKGKGRSDERWIWPSIADIIRDVRPRFVFLENVPGLIIRDGLGPVLGRLALDGYDAEWIVVSASGVGAPHERRRLYLLGHAMCSGLERLHETNRGINLQSTTGDIWRFWYPEPAMARVANGIPNRADRIRLCGNGVVPLQAAAAFVELVRRAEAIG
jgi:DNA (cytosine-5)-methyltransferase 1